MTSGGSIVGGEQVDFHLGAVDLGIGTTDNVTGIARLDNVSLAFLDAGVYTGDITASFAGDSNFDASNSSADLGVTPAPLSIVADSQTKVYGQSNPTFTGTVFGIMNGDDVTANYSSSSNPFSDVLPGGYAITLAGLTGAKAFDYSTAVTGGSFSPGTLDVTPAPLWVIADAQSKVYGQSNPTFTATAFGVLNGDDVTASLTSPAGQFSDVLPGGYAITLAGLSGSKALDYSTAVIGGSFTPGVLNVTRAPL